MPTKLRVTQPTESTPPAAWKCPRCGQVWAWWYAGPCSCVQWFCRGMAASSANVDIVVGAKRKWDDSAIRRGDG